MTHRVSLVVVSLVLVDEYDAPARINPAEFSGDAESTAVEKAKAWLEKIPALLAEFDAQEKS